MTTKRKPRNPKREDSEFEAVRRETLKLLRVIRAAITIQTTRLLERAHEKYKDGDLDKALKLAKVALDCIESEALWLGK